MLVIGCFFLMGHVIQGELLTNARLLIKKYIIYIIILTTEHACTVSLPRDQIKQSFL